MKNILFVCTGNSARSIIAETIINNKYQSQFKGYSAGSKPSEKINNYIKDYLLKKQYDVSNCYPKNFTTFLDSDIIMDYVVTVCNNANEEICPIWPKKNKIIHWDIKDPVISLNKTAKLNDKYKIIEKTYNAINQKIENLINGY